MGASIVAMAIRVAAAALVEERRVRRKLRYAMTTSSWEGAAAVAVQQSRHCRDQLLVYGFTHDDAVAASTTTPGVKTTRNQGTHSCQMSVAGRVWCDPHFDRRRFILR